MRVCFARGRRFELTGGFIKNAWLSALSRAVARRAHAREARGRLQHAQGIANNPSENGQALHPRDYGCEPG